MIQSDEELADLCKKGDDKAYQELMRRYLKPIFNFAKQYTRSNEDAEDITQDAFFKAWKYIKKFTSGRQFKPWLYTIARNTALDHIKKKKALSFSELDDVNSDASFAETLEDKDPLPTELFENAAHATMLTTALSDIHPEHRAVLTLHYHEEMTFEEISTVLGKPMNTVKSWHRRALARLKQELMHQKP